MGGYPQFIPGGSRVLDQAAALVEAHIKIHRGDAEKTFNHTLALPSRTGVPPLFAARTVAVQCQGRHRENFLVTTKTVVTSVTTLCVVSRPSEDKTRSAGDSVPTLSKEPRAS